MEPSIRLYSGTIDPIAFYNQCHNPSDGKFCGDPGNYSPAVKSYLKNEYLLSPEKAKEIGLRQDGAKLLIPFKNEQGKITGYKWRNTAIKSKEQEQVDKGPDFWRWGPADKKFGLSIYETKDKKGPIYVVESPSEGLILSALNKRVVFFDGADSLVSRGDNKINKELFSRFKRIVKGQESILVQDNDVRGNAFADALDGVVSKRQYPPEGHKDLRSYLLEDRNGLDKL